MSKPVRNSKNLEDMRMETPYLQEIKEAAELDLAINSQMKINHQFHADTVIGNLVALKNAKLAQVKAAKNE